MKRIICIGNRYITGDSAGPAVGDRLRSTPIPLGVEIIDGGICGLDLIRLVEGCRQVVFVDALTGVTEPGVVLLDMNSAVSSSCRYGHCSGLEYLLAVLPAVCEGPLPTVNVVGISGADEATLTSAVDLCLMLVAPSTELPTAGEPQTYTAAPSYTGGAK